MEQFYVGTMVHIILDYFMIYGDKRLNGGYYIIYSYFINLSKRTYLSIRRRGPPSLLLTIHHKVV